MKRHLRWLAVALAVGACSDDGRPAVAPQVEFVAPATADGTPAENLALPLTSLQRLARTDEELLNLAAYRSTADCMAAQGFGYPPYQPGVPSYGDLDHPFGPWTEDEIAQGYGQGGDESLQPSLLEEFISALPASEAVSWGAAWGGRDPFGGPRSTVTLPDGTAEESGFGAGYQEGCSFLGFDTVFGDYLYHEELRQEIEALVNEAFVEAEGADIVDQALEVWEQCMEAEGVDVDDGPEGPTQLAGEYGSEPGVSEEERTVSLLDVGCKAEANLHDAYFVARAEVEERVIEEHQLFVEAWRELVNDSLARAREIVAGGGG